MTANKKLEETLNFTYVKELILEMAEDALKAYQERGIDMKTYLKYRLVLDIFKDSLK